MLSESTQSIIFDITTKGMIMSNDNQFISHSSKFSFKRMLVPSQHDMLISKLGGRIYIIQQTFRLHHVQTQSLDCYKTLHRYQFKRYLKVKIIGEHFRTSVCRRTGFVAQSSVIVFSEPKIEYPIRCFIGWSFKPSYPSSINCQSYRVVFAEVFLIKISGRIQSSIVSRYSKFLNRFFLQHFKATHFMLVMIYTKKCFNILPRILHLFTFGLLLFVAFQSKKLISFISNQLSMELPLLRYSDQ